MTYTTPVTVITDELITVNKINQQWQDNIAHLAAMKNVLGIALSAATAGDGITALSGCLLRKSANQVITHNTVTDITWDTEEYDVGSYHSTGASTELITIPVGAVSGYAHLFGHFSLTLGSDIEGYMLIQLFKNGAQIKGLSAALEAHPGSATAYAGITLDIIVPIAASDTFKVRVYHVNSGSNDMNLVGGATGSYLGLVRVA